MNILVVHDREEIGAEIVSIVNDCGVGVVSTLVADAAEARTQLEGKFYDLLILDLTIPNVSGRGDSGFHVAEGLLEELLSSDRYLQPGGVLGITQDPGALDRIQNNIGPHLMAIISEDIDGAWRAQLRDRVKYVRGSFQSRRNAWFKNFDFDVLIETALDKELTPILGLFETRSLKHLPGVSEFLFSDRNGVVRRGACSAIGRAGQPSAASETQGLICQLRPKLVIMTGFCGGVLSKVALGDILFAETTFDWDYGKWKLSGNSARLYARPEPIGIRNTTAHRVARQLVEHDFSERERLDKEVKIRSSDEIIHPRMHLVPFASGSSVVGEEEVVEKIKLLNDNISGVDMESFGFYYACKYPKAALPDFICMKAVADGCGANKDDRLHEVCSYSSAFVAHYILTKIWNFE